MTLTYSFYLAYTISTFFAMTISFIFGR